MSSENNQTGTNRRIAKNAVMLYIRMFISMVVSLYTSRVVLNVLGVEDYGIYGVVGGVVAMMGFLNASMSGATSRFLTFELGRGDRKRLADTFSSALIVHIGIALVVLLAAETIGLWFLTHKLVIPAGRMTAAHWVYQMSIASAMLGITQVPYNATIIAHEKMDVYAYVEILNVVLKLVIVYLLIIGNFDKLILYAALMLGVSILIRMIYRIYCIRHYEESHFHWLWNKRILKPLLSFSGWDLYGNGCVTARFQGQTFLINMFHGLAYNAASSIATTIYSTIQSLSFNVVQAYRPQIIKQYSIGDIAQMQDLMQDATKYTLILMGTFAIPCYVEMPYVLNLWLGQIPVGAVFFGRALLIYMISMVINTVVSIGIHSTGNIKSISFISGTIQLLNVPVLYVLFKCGLGVNWAYILMLIVIAIVTITNILICKNLIPQLGMKKYISSSAVIVASVVVCGLPCIPVHFAMPENFIRLVAVIISSVIPILVVSYFILLEKEERRRIKQYLCRRFQS